MAEPASNEIIRRSFLTKLAGGISASALFALGCSPDASTAPARKNSSIRRAYTRTPTYQGEALGYTALEPAYIPNTYRLVERYVGRKDGFRGGASELVLWYKTPAVEHGQSLPLCVFMCPNPTQKFAMTEEKPGVEMSLYMTSGEQVAARYYDGIWVVAKDGEWLHPAGSRLHWMNTNAHAIVFNWRGLSIGVRGCRKANIDFDELQRVCSSLAPSQA